MTHRSRKNSKKPSKHNALSIATSRGTYVLAIHLPDSRRLKIGALGYRELEKGYYVYVGSARRHLAKRIARHLKKRKPLWWHIDYITSLPETNIVKVVATDRVGVECSLSSSLASMGKAIPKIGSSDCRCPSHLIYFPTLKTVGKAVQKTFHRL
ncbi:MAG: GIY-YIG nuclease family protein [Candidatus Caldarchaeum sp.]